MAIRKIGVVSRTYQHMNRYRQILTVLAKYGFDDLIDRLKIGHYLEIGYQIVARQRREQIARMSRPERVRIILEELGPTFVKLGQMASTRPDLFPAEYIVELEKLCDQVPPFPFENVRQITEAELGRPLDQCFTRFEHASLAAASIGQVHRAQLLDGQEVVVKVQRPGIRHTIEVDLEILLHLATLLERHVEGARLHRPTKIVEEFGRIMDQELDYGVERAHLERFANQFLDDDTVYVPKVYDEYSTNRVLTMEYVSGVGPLDFKALERQNLDRKRIAAHGAESILKQVFVHGFFHADPHQGNTLVLPNNVVCYLDFGMMGRLDRRTRENLADLIYGAAAADAPDTVTALLRLTEHEDEHEPDLRALERDVSEIIDLQIGTRIGTVNLGRLVDLLLNLIKRHQLRIPADLVTMLKAMATAEGVGAALDPELNMVAAAAPYVRKLKLERFSPRRVIGELLDSGVDLLQLLREMPSGARDLLKLAKRGGLRVGLEHRGFEKMLDTYDRIANRVSFAIVVAALIIGSSLIVLSKLPPTWHEIPVIGLVGFIAAGLMGLLLLISILRHGRM